MQTLILLLLFLVSCSNPFEDRGKLIFRDLKQEAILENQLKAQLAVDKKEEWNSIVADAQESFQYIRPILENKCFDCHDKNTKLPLYARALPNINPLTKHQSDGIKALDFSEMFPLKAQGSPKQLSLLTALKNAILDRTMPLRSYTAFYRSKKINHDDEDQLLAWIDPLIERIQHYNDKYAEISSSAPQILEQKCFRCHANGAHKGGFGEMENTAKLLKSKYVDPQDPAESVLYTISHSGEMPPNPREALTQDELILLRDWLELEVTKIKN